MTPDQDREFDRLRQMQFLEAIVAQNSDVVNSKDVSALIFGDVNFDGEGRPDGQSVAMAIASLRKRSGYLFRSQRADAGRPAAQASGIDASSRDIATAKLLFGRGANAILAQELAKEDKEEYRRLREVAKRYKVFGE